MITEPQAERMTCVELRRADPADFGALMEMYGTFEPKGAALGLPPQAGVKEWLDGLARYVNFVVFVDGRLAGHSVLCNNGDTAEAAVFVHQAYRGRGLGQRLLAAMVSEARHLGLRCIWGTAEMDNYGALGMARALGFVPGRYANEYYLDLKQPASAEKEIVSCT